MYIIHATVNGIQIPTFFLDENIQGITSEWHAEYIAQDILNPMHDPNLRVSISAVKK